MRYTDIFDFPAGMLLVLETSFWQAAKKSSRAAVATIERILKLVFICKFLMIKNRLEWGLAGN
jgi:hypothetical protein